MELIRLDNQTSQNKYSEIDRLAGGEFLQSEFWGEIISRGGEIVERWGVKDSGKNNGETGGKDSQENDGEKIIAAVTLIKKPLFGPFFYWYAPRGPRGSLAAVNFLLCELKNRKSSAVFLRLEPEELPGADELRGKKETGNVDLETGNMDFKKSLDLQPKKTLLLDLSKSEEELLKEMHQKTRYNIKLAEKKGVKIIPGEIKDFNDFWRLMNLTSSRDDFRLHSADHYKKLLRAGNLKLFFAQAEGKNIATGLFCFFGDRVTYLHGASDNEARNLMAPYLLQWEVIKIAQKEGYKYYDFYGIDEKKWPGVTRFKVGFGGFIKEYPGTYDFVFRPGIYGFYEFLRKLRRRFN